jgi:hypothetical protein
LKAFQREIVVNGVKAIRAKHSPTDWFIHFTSILCVLISVMLGWEVFYGFPEKFTGLVNFVTWFYVIFSVCIFLFGLFSVCILFLLYGYKASEADKEPYNTQKIKSYHDFMLDMLFFEARPFAYSVFNRTVNVFNILCLAALNWTFIAIILTLISLFLYVVEKIMENELLDYFSGLTEEKVEQLR